jgi:subtilisin family serine protease
MRNGLLIIGGAGRWSRLLPVAIALMLALSPGASLADPGGTSSDGALEADSAAAAARPAADVTLITGDRVLVDWSPDGAPQTTIDPAARDGLAPDFQTWYQDDQVYVVPSDAAPLVGEQLDVELFNVTKLAALGATAGLPVLLSYDRADARQPRARTHAGPIGLTDARELPSVDGLAGTIEPDGSWWRATASTSTTGGAGIMAAAEPLGGVARVWLDDRVEASLDESVPLIGAPEAWAGGLDGSGVTVAVLDTGVDASHPDLAGKVVDERNFTDEPSAADGHGHGTHVASTVAGSGAASGGAYTGVAPGATLLSGKVLDDNGNGTFSSVIAGMEWAAEQGADVINMSLGAGPTDGTDPMSQAVNQLTADHGVLFVISAGNSGPSDGTVGSPGAADAALTVGAVNKNEQLAGFSSRGPRPGDFAIKPDVTAPGVGIVAARSADGTLPPPAEPVNDFYIRASGTSMAAPHVAGAAAILLQGAPELGPAALKERLVTTAVRHPGLDSFQQGGGRIDVPSALDARVHAAPATLNLGYLPYPHDDAEPVLTDVTYTNLTDAPMTLGLAFEVRSREFRVPGPEMLSVEPASLTVEPGATAQATITLDVTAGEYGLYSGYLTASEADQPVVTTPVGFHKEPERYDLRIIGIDREGRPATGSSSVGVLDVEDMIRFFRPAMGFLNGELRLRVPPATYSVLGGIQTYDERGEQIVSTTFLGDAEVSVTEDTTIVLDARTANRITVATPEPDAVPQGGVSFGYWRTADRPGPLLGIVWLATHAAREYYAGPTGPVTLGGFEFHSRWRIGAPEATLAVVDPVELPLDPVLLRHPAVDGEQVVALVDAGIGSAEDFAAVDVAGAVALVQRASVPFGEQEARAAAAGAIALVVTNGLPGRLTGPLGETGTIPVLSLTTEEGDALRALLADGEVTVRLGGTVWSPYLYDLVVLEIGEVGSDLSYEVTPDQLAKLEIAYHNDVADHVMNEGRHFSRPFHAGSIYLYPPVSGPRERTEYLIGGDAMSYQQTVYGEEPFEARLREQSYFLYEPGTTVARSWFRQPVRPSLLPDVGLTTRSGDVLNLHAYEWVDAAGNHFPHLFGLAPYPGDTIVTRLFRDGDQIAQAGVPRHSFTLAPEVADYRVELDVTRDAGWWERSTSTHTAWSFRSARPEAGSEVLPLLSADYVLELDVWNAVPHPRERRGAASLGLVVSHQPGSDASPVAGARVWVSYDDGATWAERPGKALGGGRFDFRLDSRDSADSTGFASLRVEAWDADGNRFEQEIIRAWRLTPR